MEQSSNSNNIRAGDGNIAEAKKKAAYMLGQRAMSRSELIDKLVKKGFTPECSMAAADTFEGLGVIDDREYADRLCRRYLAKGYGSHRIKAELLRRGVGEETPDLSEADVSEAVDKFLSSRLKDAADRAELRRVSDALHRRGFNWDEISAGIERYTSNSEEK